MLISNYPTRDRERYNYCLETWKDYKHCLNDARTTNFPSIVQAFVNLFYRVSDIKVIHKKMWYCKLCAAFCGKPLQFQRLALERFEGWD